MKRLSHWILTVLTFTVLTSISFIENASSEEPPMPKGFNTKKDLEAAIFMGKIKLIDAGNVPVPDSILKEKAIEYSNIDGISLKLDLYRPKNTDQPTPLIVFIHGGSWKGGKREDMKFYTVRYAKQGYATATVTYRLTQQAPFPAAVNDVKCAVRFLRANAKEYNIDPDRIAVSGNSAGGHLAMMVGYSSDVKELDGNREYPETSSSVKAVVNYYGPVDLTTDFARSKGVVRDFLNGKTYSEAPELYRQASPITHVTKDDPPTIIFHGTIDEVVPINQADILASKLKELGIPVHYEKFEGWIHGMDLAQAVNDRCCYLLDHFLSEHLKS